MGHSRLMSWYARCQGDGSPASRLRAASCGHGAPAIMALLGNRVFVIMEMLMRARGALYGLAIGDALGMPAQMLSRAEIVRRWGPLLPGFEPAPPGHTIAAGMPAGTVTDDTEQAVLLGRLLVKDHGTVDPHELA